MDEPKNAWRPFVLSPWIPAGLCAILILAGIGLEVRVMQWARAIRSLTTSQIAYKFTVQNNGWPLPPNPTNQDSIHYVYTW